MFRLSLPLPPPLRRFVFACLQFHFVFIATVVVVVAAAVAATAHAKLTAMFALVRCLSLSPAHSALLPSLSLSLALSLSVRTLRQADWPVAATAPLPFRPHLY